MSVRGGVADLVLKCFVYLAAASVSCGKKKKPSGETSGGLALFSSCMHSQRPMPVSGAHFQKYQMRTVHLEVKSRPKGLLVQ